MMRKMAGLAQGKAKQTVEQEGDNFTIVISSPVKSFTEKFTVGEEFTNKSPMTGDVNKKIRNT